MDHIFISYSRKDTATADDLIARLTARGCQVWLDRTQIQGGEVWRRSIVIAIDECSAFVIVLSPNSVQSDNVRKELSLAESKHKKIIPVLIQETRLTPDFEYQLADLQNISLLSNDGMGSDPGRDKTAQAVELPQHRLNLSYPYYIAKYLTTTDQFRAFINDSGYQSTDDHSLMGWGNHPVSFVTWNDALKYCDWLNAQLLRSKNTPRELMRLLESGWCVTLPSEAEWEKAARSVDRRIYPWGDDLAVYNKANLDHYGESYTTAVGCFLNGNSPFGLTDMSGNVWEWTRTLWGPNHDHLVFKYPYDEKDGREDLKAEGARVLRGGSYAEPASNGRCAFRDGYHTDARSGSMGFRVAIVNQKP